mmetsp:Transcript_60943/g.188739  ORF Transcript_60943/g.188739 Transcript_60943/m.188739 type:complete len:218 (+) Transcript_60943:666-1319(+)
MTRQPYMCEAILSVCSSTALMMKSTESGGICSMHFWMTWLPCMLSMQPTTFLPSSDAIICCDSLDACWIAFWMTRQPLDSLDNLKTFFFRPSASCLRCSGFPMSNSFWTTKAPKASLDSRAASGTMAVNTACFSSASASSSFVWRKRLPWWSWANSRMWGKTSRRGILHLAPCRRTSCNARLRFGLESSSETASGEGARSRVPFFFLPRRRRSRLPP